MATLLISVGVPPVPLCRYNLCWNTDYLWTQVTGDAHLSARLYMHRALNFSHVSLTIQTIQFIFCDHRIFWSCEDFVAY